MKVGIAIDDWKLPFFVKHLTTAKYAYNQYPGVVDGTFLLKVNTDNPDKLELIVRAANTEAARYKERTKGNQQ